MAGAIERSGRWSVLLAAYAFVVNASPATTLLSATAPAKSRSGFELRVSGGEAFPQADHDDRSTKRAAVHY